MKAGIKLVFPETITLEVEQGYDNFQVNYTGSKKRLYFLGRFLKLIEKNSKDATTLNDEYEFINDSKKDQSILIYTFALAYNSYWLSKFPKITGDFYKGIQIVENNQTLVPLEKIYEILTREFTRLEKEKIWSFTYKILDKINVSNALLYILKFAVQENYQLPVFNIYVNFLRESSSFKLNEVFPRSMRFKQDAYNVRYALQENIDWKKLIEDFPTDKETVGYAIECEKFPLNKMGNVLRNCLVLDEIFDIKCVPSFE